MACCCHFCVFWAFTVHQARFQIPFFAYSPHRTPHIPHPALPPPKISGGITPARPSVAQHFFISTHSSLLLTMASFEMHVMHLHAFTCVYERLKYDVLGHGCRGTCFIVPLTWLKVKTHNNNNRTTATTTTAEDNAKLYPHLHPPFSLWPTQLCTAACC